MDIRVARNYCQMNRNDEKELHREKDQLLIDNHPEELLKKTYYFIHGMDRLSQSI